jgi:hypothetical protein
MDILYAIAGVFLLLVLHVNIKVTRIISRSQPSSIKQRIFSYTVVWLIPILGTLLVPKTIMPELHKGKIGSGISGDGCGGGDCG